MHRNINLTSSLDMHRYVTQYQIMDHIPQKRNFLDDRVVIPKVMTRSIRLLKKENGAMDLRGFASLYN